MTRVPGDKDFWWLFDAAAEAMLLADVGGAILARNASCDRLFGYTAEEWAGLCIEDLIPERSRAAHQHFRAAYAVKPVSRAMGRGGEFQGLRKDGTEFPARVSLSAVPGAEGPVVLAIVEDITAQRQAEEALLAREAQLGLAVRVTGLASWEWNPHADAVYLSPEWKAQLGYADDELPSRATEWRSCFHPDDLRAVQDVIDEVRSGRRNEIEIRYRLRHRDGSFRWMQSRAVLLPTQAGEGSRLLGMQWDVTDQVVNARQLGEWRNEVESLRQVQVALETAAAIVHEINQPLNAMLSFCEVAQMLRRQGSTDKLDDALSGAVAQAGRAGQVVRDLLKFLEQREMPTAAIDLNRVVREAVSLVTTGDDPGFRIALSLASALPPVLANEIQIKKVMATLLRNGAEAMAGAGLAGEVITIAVSTVNAGAMAQVSVRDSGTGLDPATVEHIFEPFFTTKPRGIGMGLATSRRIIERLGGKLWFEAGAAGGATFHFTVPFAP
jgi:two-component system, LuxR family, sensor kinase FixL